MQYYFAYGSNLHHAQMQRRCPKCRYIKKHILHGYQLTFRSKYGACDIERRTGKKVYGALYVISRCAEKRLDVYEEYPTLYKKIYFNYKGNKVMTYTMVKKTHFTYPKERYLNTIKQGYKDCGLDIHFLFKILKSNN